jgi:oligo-1,6-glucosidase
MTSAATGADPLASGGASNEPWWRRATVYQIYPRSFADSNGDGIGDIGGIISRLDYLAALGVGVLWLSPIYPSPQDDNGYDISDYQDVDPLFGSLADFDELLRQTHRRGMRLIMDLVVNHTSDEHPWFVESRDPASPKRDWYWWRPGTQDGPPNNWGSRFSGPAWERDEQSGEYYLHIFSRKQPDLNWENPELRRAVYAMMGWWLDRGVDGFRMDVINFISKDTDLPDAPVPPGSLYGQARGYYINGPRLHDFLQEMHREVFAGRPGRLLTVGETPKVTPQDGRLFTDPARGELDMIFQFDHVDLDQGRDKWDPRPLDLVALKAIFNGWQQGLAETGWNSLYWNNHDQPRVVSRWGDDGRFRVESAKALATVLHLHRGTPYVYQGEELGMTNVPFTSIEEFRDIQSINHYHEATAVLGRDPGRVLEALRQRSRDNGRSPMQWDASAQAGFTTGVPWLSVNSNHEVVNAAAQVGDPASVWSHYRALIDLRRTEPLVTEGVFRPLAEDHPRLWAFRREQGGRALLVLANFSAAELEVPQEIVPPGPARLLLGNYGDPGHGAGVPRRLRPWEATVHLVGGGDG